MEELARRKETKAGSIKISQISIKSYFSQGRGGEEDIKVVMPKTSLPKARCSYRASLGVQKVGRKAGTSRPSNTNPDTERREQLVQLKGRKRDENPL